MNVNVSSYRWISTKCGTNKRRHELCPAPVSAGSSQCLLNVSEALKPAIEI